eukprot:TRINITY_DN14670_c0_g1_i2.p1 TRINITY_DN14670_c0_g1~~TRINITY_DN14670_c0_g1_i2.p1  ORF type:complete len:285 (+),score=21.42 TRINITY_DN14670_c0_g1_i2:102-857(+)
MVTYVGAGRGGISSQFAFSDLTRHESITFERCGFIASFSMLTRLEWALADGNCFMLSATCSANNIYAVLIRRTLDRNTQKEIVTMRLPFSFRYAADDEQSEPLAYDLHDYLLRPLDLEADMDEDEADALRMQQVRKTFFKDGAIDPFAGSNFADYNQEGYTGPSRIEQLKDFESRTGFLLAMPMRTVERLISGKQTKVSISLVMYDVKTQDVVHLQFTPQMHMGDEITQLVPFVDYSGPTPKMGRPTQQMS